MARLVTIKKSETPWTKAEEIQVLREFVAQLPNGSYLKGILEGIEEYAEGQIQNDWSLSVVRELEEVRSDLLKTQSDLVKAVNEKTQLQERLNQMAEDLFKLQREVDYQSQVRREEAEARIASEQERAKLKAEVERQAEEIIRLKARLFDYIEKEHGAA